MTPWRWRSAGAWAAGVAALGVSACATPPTCPAAVTASAALAPPAIAALHVLGTAALARRPGVMQHFGGISGMDWDPRSGWWYLLSDDRSAEAPARFYTARLRIGSMGFAELAVEAAVPLRRPDGSRYPPLASAAPGDDVPDPEALRIDPCGGDLLWSSEGDRRRGGDPAIQRATLDGRWLGRLPLPDVLRVHPDREAGARNNLSLEGLAFTPDGAGLWAAMEAPIYEDGPPASTGHGAAVRFTRYARSAPSAAWAPAAQVVYPVEAIPHPATGGARRADNGVSEILALDAHRLLVVERAGRETADGVFAFSARLYEATDDGATDVSALPSLAGAAVVPMRKRLVLDLERAGLDRIDNIEAAAWGPRLPDGRATLVLASDDNFSPQQINQFIVLAVDPR